MATLEEEIGPAIPLASSPSVPDIFRMFFTSALMATVVDQTNAYARLVLEDIRPWREVTADDLWALFGLMGINHLPALQHYWSTDPLMHYAPVASHISRNRFLSIWRFLHFTDAPPPPASSPSSPPPDHLYKVRPVITGCLPHQLPASSGASC